MKRESTLIPPFWIILFVPTIILAFCDLSTTWNIPITTYFIVIGIALLSTLISYKFQIIYKDEPDSLRKYSIITLIFGVFIAILAPFIFTLPNRFEIFSLKGYGDIGDIIGGSTAPIIGTVNAILLYLAFKAQLDASNKIENQRNYDIKTKELEMLYMQISQDVSNFVYTIIVRDEDEIILTVIEIKGSVGINALIKKWYCEHYTSNDSVMSDSNIAEMYGILSKIDLFCVKYNELVRKLNEDSNGFANFKLQLTYKELIKNILRYQILCFFYDKNIALVHRCPSCSKSGKDIYHGFPKEVRDLIMYLIEKFEINDFHFGSDSKNTHSKIFSYKRKIKKLKLENSNLKRKLLNMKRKLKRNNL